MDGSSIAVCINLIDEENKDQFERFHLAIQSGHDTAWQETLINSDNPHRTLAVIFNNLVEDTIYTVLGQYRQNNQWYDIPNTSVAASKYLVKNIAAPLVTSESRKVCKHGLNIAMKCSPIPAKIGQAPGSPGDPGGNTGDGGGANITATYIIGYSPTQQTQNIYNANGYYVDQASACVACAIATAKEIQEYRQQKKLLHYSISWFFGSFGISDIEGMNYFTAFNALRTQGIPPVEVVTRADNKTFYPDIESFNTSKKLAGISGALTEYARPQKISSFKSYAANQTANASVIEEICSAIRNDDHGNLNSTAVLATITIDKSFDDATWNGTGIVGPLKGGQQRGGHCMAVLGWYTKGALKYWVVRNSWTNWYTGMHMNNSGISGDNGLFYIPFNWYGAEDGYLIGLNEFYILYDDPNAPALPNISSLKIDSVTPTTAKWTISNLGNPFNSSYYKNAGVTSSKFTVEAGSISDIVSFAKPPLSGGSTSISGTVANLTPGTSYELWGYAQAFNGTYYPMGNKQSCKFTTISAISLWRWESPKASGNAFNVTPSEWRNFCNRINEVRRSYGDDPYDFTLDSSNIASSKPFYAWIFKQAAVAIRDINKKNASSTNPFGVDSACCNVAQGDTIKASYFTNLAAALNNAINWR